VLVNNNAYMKSSCVIANYNWKPSKSICSSVLSCYFEADDVKKHMPVIDGGVFHNYRIAQNCGGGKLWRIWWIEYHSPIFYPTKFISIFCKTLDFRIKVSKCTSRDLRCELGCEAVNLEISPSPSWSRSKIWSFRLTIFIFVITSKDIFYRKCVHRWSRVKWSIVS